eukprot:5157351-Pyramimonas_sp.AAC.1
MPCVARGGSAREKNSQLSKACRARPGQGRDSRSRDFRLPAGKSHHWPSQIGPVCPLVSSTTHASLLIEQLAW